jgi:hypothetical protein
LPDLAHILLAFNVVSALLSSNINYPRIVRSVSSGVSTSKITLYVASIVGLSPATGTTPDAHVVTSDQYLIVSSSTESPKDEQVVLQITP